MNSQKIYDSLIDRAKSRNTIDGEYYERHHIRPRSMGGLDDPENIVILTGREHFIAHWLLFKIYRNRSMALAWSSMKMDRDGNRYTSISAGYARKYHAAITSESNRSRVWTPEMRKKSSDARTGIFTRGLHQRARKVINTETGEVFQCMTDAADALGVTKAAVQNSITRKGRCKGVKFAHAD